MKSDRLFQKLMYQIEKLIYVGDRASSSLSDFGKTYLKSGSLSMRQSYWQEIVITIKDRYIKLKQLLESPAEKDDKKKLDQRLAFFREMSRRISESPPEWSSYYNDINRALRDVCYYTREIDIKYHLGQHKDDA